MKKYSMTRYEDTAAMIGNDLRLKVEEKKDRSFRVVAQRRSGFGLNGKIQLKLQYAKEKGIPIPANLIPKP